jgi:hypothetical protein
MRYNHLEMLPEEAFQKVGKSIKLYGKGGGGTTQSTGTTYTTNIPEYAQPYVETMLGATQKQLFNMTPQGEITGFQPYVPYSTNAQDYVAGFSPMQQQAFQGAANLHTPGQFAGATDLAGASGLGSLGAGYRYQQQATNPNAVQAYMNPYLQSSLAPQLESMRRQYGITGTQQQGQATQAGAFGGTREALMAAENNRAMNSAMDNAIAQGYNTAFNNAQQQQQFGANLGLQGLGQAGQAAGTLGQLGTQQLAAQQGVIGLQGQMGAQQQAQQQQMINQSIQDYATQQQYPMMQLGMMSNMLRGLPMQGVTTQSYQATPNALTQGIGALGTGLSLSNALGGTAKAAGGEIKSYAKGGITSFDVGGDVKSDLYDYSPEKLNEVIKSTESETVRNLARSILKDKTGMAGGGIIAFANRGLVDKEEAAQIEEDRLSLLKPFAAAADVIQMPVAGAMNLAGEGVEQLANYGGRVINAVTGEPTVRTDYESPSFGATPFYDKLTGRTAAAAPVAAKPAAMPVAAKPAAGLPPAAEKVKPTQEAKPAKEKSAAKTQVAAENATPAQSAAYMPTTQSVEEGILSALPQAAQDYLRNKPTEQTTAEIAAQQSKDREAFMGPNTAAAEYRKSVMDQKASAKDEAERLQQMRLAEFFSVWGSTPGPTLVAGMQAAQKTIPNLIKDKDDQKKAKAELDKIIYNLDQASRLEKAGEWEAAAKVKQEQAKASQAWGENWLKAAESEARNKTTLQAGREQNISQEKQTAARNAASLEEAKIRSTESSGIKNLEFARKASEDYQSVEKEIEALKSNPKGPYQEALKAKTMLAKSAKEDPTGQAAVMYNAAVDTLGKLDRNYGTRLKSAKDTKESFYKQAGYNNPAVDDKDPFGIR